MRRFNPHSISFRLIAWFSGLLVLVVVLFGAFTYARLAHFLVEVQRLALLHRAERIGTLVQGIPKHGEDYVSTQVELRFAPEQNDKLVRVTRPDGSILFLSGEPFDHSFDPAQIPPLPAGLASEMTRRVPGRGAQVLVTALPIHDAAGRRYWVETGNSLASSDRVLHAFLLTLALGLLVVVSLAILGGYIVLRRALGPVQSIMRAAQEITLHHLSRRLPVPESGDEIANLSVVLNQMIARLDESFQNTSRFTADASHELRTPLTIIRGELEGLLLRGKLPPETRDHLGSLLEEIERLVRIVEGLFALTRLDNGEAQSERVRLDLAQLAATTVEQICMLAAEKKIAIEARTSESVEVEGDRARLKQVIVNLIDNAIKYTPHGGRVTVSVSSQPPSHALCEVADTGPGVSEADLPHLFERFYRSERHRSGEIAGAGLGLPIVHSIVTAHCGSISVQNAEPHGCRVLITLPRAA